jgi:hypothetical protein
MFEVKSEQTFLAERDPQMCDWSGFIDDVAATTGLTTPTADPQAPAGRYTLQACCTQTK